MHKGERCAQQHDRLARPLHLAEPLRQPFQQQRVALDKKFTVFAGHHTKHVRE